MARMLPCGSHMGWNKVTDIEAWNLSMKLSKEFGAILDRPPASKDRRFCEDALDAVGSPARNIAEGFGRYNDREFARYADIAYGSHLETQTNLQAARDRQFLSAAEFNRLMELSNEAKATTLGLIKMLKRRIAEAEAQARAAKRRRRE